MSAAYALMGRSREEAAALMPQPVGADLAVAGLGQWRPDDIACFADDKLGQPDDEDEDEKSWAAQRANVPWD